MRYSIILLLILSSCNERNDFEFLIENLDDQKGYTSYQIDTMDNMVERFDDKGFLIDKHWFNSENEIEMYIQHNKFENSDAYFMVKFNKGGIKEVKGYPLYLSADFVGKDSVKLDTLRAFIYLAESPFFDSKLKIYTHNLTKDELYLNEKNNPDFFIYYEDYPDSTFQKMKYSFYYDLRSQNFEFQDSAIFICDLYNIPS